VPWLLLGVLAGGSALLFGHHLQQRAQQRAAARASGLAPIADLSHLPASLQRTALWALADGGFERRVVHGVVTRGGADIAVTAFDLETLRERRGEWAFLPVEPPFRIAGVVSVVVCELDRSLPHVLLKRSGYGDALADDGLAPLTAALVMRDALGLAKSYPAELPATLAANAMDVGLPARWRAYANPASTAVALFDESFVAALARVERRDLVVELVDSLVVVYPAAREVAGADALADLTHDALAIVDGVRAGQLTPRGVTA
jgi:hypothetical protein